MSRISRMLYQARLFQQIGQILCASAGLITISRVKDHTHDSLNRMGRGDEQHIPNIIQEGVEIRRWRSVDNDHACSTSDAHVTQYSTIRLTSICFNTST